MEIHETIELQDCPYCGGTGLLEEENGWCWYVMCVECGAQTAAFSFGTPEERPAAAQRAADVWNMGKAIWGGAGD